MRHFEVRRANGPHTDERSSGGGELHLVTRGTTEKIVLAPAGRNGTTNGVGVDDDSRAHPFGHVDLPTALIKVDFAVPQDVVDNRDWISAHREPKQLERTGGQQLGHDLVVKGSEARRTEHAAPTLCSPALAVEAL